MALFFNSINNLTLDAANYSGYTSRQARKSETAARDELGRFFYFAGKICILGRAQGQMIRQSKSGLVIRDFCLKAVKRLCGIF
jgi:hypothetical protein